MLTDKLDMGTERKQGYTYFNSVTMVVSLEESYMENGKLENWKLFLFSGLVGCRRLLFCFVAWWFFQALLLRHKIKSLILTCLVDTQVERYKYTGGYMNQDAQEGMGLEIKT